MPRTKDDVPTEEDVEGLLLRRGCLSLRVLCIELCPWLRWRHLLDQEESIAETQIAGGKTRAQWVWGHLATLLDRGRVRVAGRDPDEVDELAAVTFEIMGRRLWM